MREFKFRAWNEHLKLMHPAKGWFADSLNQGNVMQYTGLKDKNDKEIYEGDIVNSRKGQLTVVWDESDGSFVFKTQGDYDDYNGLITHTDITIEIIGNIYENPEITEDK